VKKGYGIMADLFRLEQYFLLPYRKLMAECMAKQIKPILKKHGLPEDAIKITFPGTEEIK